jgi:polyisoprenoid-binding protein YceI
MTTMTSVRAGTWTVDLAHTRAAFTARHFFGQTVPGTIAVTDGLIEVGADGQPQLFRATLHPASIDTGHHRRDADLRGKRFLAADGYPRMEVVGDRIDATADGWRTDAVLRVRGVEAPVRIDATLDGPATASRLRVSATARLDLRDAGIRVPGFLVRRFVDLSISAQLTQEM